ncbi:MAG: DNA topoisomerase [Hoeflea sp.]|nr:DNA topoisomerase [Hoeflea sp.]|tara:strand:- start:2631 stop:3641 length:1011 start_codon:yes stop_codon:yes gene_type:complete
MPDEIDLRYSSDCEPGISRRRRGRGFSYHLPDGKTLRDKAERARINALAVPPAYREVWICGDHFGHLQATGLDDRGRKQYRYHEAWAEQRSRLKFGQLRQFGEALPRIRRRIRSDLKKGLPHEEAVLGAMVMLVDRAHLRVGNRIYAKENKTFGVTSLQKRHVRTEGGDTVSLRFTAKGGEVQDYELESTALHDILEEIADLPGRDLFSWHDEEGGRRRVSSQRLNAYLSEIGGVGVTAKTFRTWAGSVAGFGEALDALRREEPVRVKAICEAAAEKLHNTPAVCRTSYVHPEVLEIAADERRAKIALKAFETRKNTRGLNRAEERFLQYLEMCEG